MHNSPKSCPFRRLLPRAAIVVASAVGGSGGIAQMPPGSLIASGMRITPQQAPSGGLYLIDPTTGNWSTVTGLPTNLAPTPSAPAYAGAQFILRLPASGDIVAGGLVYQPGGAVEVHVLSLGGTPQVPVAGNLRTYSVGTYTTNPGVGASAAAMLGDGRVLITVDPFGINLVPPLSPTGLVVLDPSLPPSVPGALVSVPVPNLPSGFVNALAVDLTQGIAYVANQSQVGSFSGSQASVLAIGPGGDLLVGHEAGISRWDGVAWAPYATGIGFVDALATLPDGRLFAGGRLMPSSQNFAVWDGASWTPLGPAYFAAYGRVGETNSGPDRPNPSAPRSRSSKEASTRESDRREPGHSSRLARHQPDHSPATTLGEPLFLDNRGAGRNLPWSRPAPSRTPTMTRARARVVPLGRTETVT